MAAEQTTTYRKQIPKTHFYPADIRQLVAQRRRLRRKWLRTRNPLDKAAFNKMASNVKKALIEHNNKTFHRYLTSLSPSKDTEFSLWKATKQLGRPPNTNLPLKDDNGMWVRKNSKKAKLFSHNLEKQFKPNEIHSDLDPRVTFKGKGVIKPISPLEVAHKIDKLNTKKICRPG